MTSVHTCMYPVCVCVRMCVYMCMCICVYVCADLHACVCIRIDHIRSCTWCVYVFQDAVDWVKGDRIVIAPTGKDGNETEVSVHTALC